MVPSLVSAPIYLLCLYLCTHVQAQMHTVRFRERRRGRERARARGSDTDTHQNTETQTHTHTKTHTYLHNHTLSWLVGCVALHLSHIHTHIFHRTHKNVCDTHTCSSHTHICDSLYQGFTHGSPFMSHTHMCLFSSLSHTRVSRHHKQTHTHNHTLSWPVGSRWPSTCVCET